MDTQCWQRLGIEPTQDLDVIRQAYRQKVPQFHPETDPEGFKQLRDAYDTACKLAKNPVLSGEEEQTPPNHKTPPRQPRRPPLNRKKRWLTRLSSC